MRHVLTFFAGLVFAMAAWTAHAQAADASSYKLGAGDVITIRVLGEDDLKREKVRLSDAGTVSFPVLGELKVKGLTVGDLEQLITRGLKGRYLVNPQVTVSVEEYRNYFVNGMAEKPGGYPYVPGLTVRKAISVAGGFNERAARDKINIIREDDPSNTPHRVSLDAFVHPGDIITIEESFF